ncbi:MAG: glycosyltransferase [Anaerolineales bacterium]|nr:glycosyltransferase [Anaerolineales bacterium]
MGAVEFHPYVPAADVFPYCDWTICHGGQNTIVQSLMNGVPLLVFPGPIFERRFNARKIQQVGAGLMREVNKFTVEWISRAFESQPACALKASQLIKRIHFFGGANTAVEAMDARRSHKRANGD